MRVREYGTSGPLVIVLHGGPAALGEAAPIARGLSDSFRSLEPWQRGSGDEPLSVARHVADLHELVEERSAGVSPALVGESWGAMLALACAAEHPDSAGAIVLVGCGSFDSQARARMHATLEQRTDEDLRKRLAAMREAIEDPGERIMKFAELTEKLYRFDPISHDREDTGRFDERAYSESWADMVRLQEEGIYPAAFSAIRSPVLMLHGTYDPHPGRMIQASLQPHLPQLEYQEWERCGHSPWLEKAVRDEFFEMLRDWLRRHTTRNLG